MDAKAHWESIYAAKDTASLSWYQSHPTRSLDLIGRTGVPATAKILDVGGGDSLLADVLLSRRYTDITVVDLSPTALDRARARLGNDAAGRVTWLEDDILSLSLPIAAYDLWHDRAVFHFLTARKSRDHYIEQVKRSVRQGGHVIIATFAEDGPPRCSGLPVARYSAKDLYDAFGENFRLRAAERETHQTPSGTDQIFTYCWLQYRPAARG